MKTDVAAGDATSRVSQPLRDWLMGKHNPDVAVALTATAGGGMHHDHRGLRW